jgi:hypothetical protein
LPPSHYKLVVTATGFKTASFDDISIAAESPRNPTPRHLAERSLCMADSPWPTTILISRCSMSPSRTTDPWTPVTFDLNSVPENPTSATISPVRPLAYFGCGGSDCPGDAFKTGTNFPGGGTKFFSTTLPTGKTYTPGIGRNSFRGPCYLDVDMSVAKEVRHEVLGHNTLLRFQANAFNVFNILSLPGVTCPHTLVLNM